MQEGYNMQVNAERSLVKYILLSIVTCGIYGIYFLYKLIIDVNIICAGDGDETPGLLKLLLLTIVTCGIYAWIWYYKLGNRIQMNGSRYGLNIQENGTTILLWMLLGSCLFGIGPYVAMYYIIRNVNSLAVEYNAGKRA